jgi:hypothetical protein
MLELNLSRKNKINLHDYNSQQDIENRQLISDFSSLDLKVLEEILFSPLKISFKKLIRSLQISEKELHAILQKFGRHNLLSVQDDCILVDKEMRKCFEFQIQRFDSAFKPDMEFIQGLLRKVPIHLLPIWYSLPRSSDNIFESIMEKYLLTPQIFQRYLNDLHLSDAIAQHVMQDLFASKTYTLASSDIIAKYNLSRPRFEEIMLLLEFHFICTVRYIKEEDHWHEIIQPFHEWHEYLLFLQEIKPKILDQKSVKRQKRDDFDFIQEIPELLSRGKGGQILLKPTDSAHLIDKLCQVQLAKRENDKLFVLNKGVWLSMSLENKALYLYRHPLNRPQSIAPDRNVRDATKSIQQVLHGGWVLFDHFLREAPINVECVAMLKKSGNHWKYTFPVYSSAEKELIYSFIFETLFESGMVSIGTYEGQECFALTSFGRSFFEG